MSVELLATARRRAQDRLEQVASRQLEDFGVGQARTIESELRAVSHEYGTGGTEHELVLQDVNLAIAVDLGAEGLVAPVIKEAEKMSVAQLADAIADIAHRSRTNRLKPNDFVGGTYTLSNSGTFGTLITAPIINQPQVAILSTDGVRKKPVVVETSEGDSIAIRPVGVLAQSFDHRAVDGAYSAAFLDRLRRIIETSHWSVEV